MPIDLSSWAGVDSLNAHAEDMMHALYVRMRAAMASVIAFFFLVSRRWLGVGLSYNSV